MYKRLHERNGWQVQFQPRSGQPIGWVLALGGPLGAMVEDVASTARHARSQVTSLPFERHIKRTIDPRRRRDRLKFVVLTRLGRVGARAERPTDRPRRRLRARRLSMTATNGSQINQNPMRKRNACTWRVRKPSPPRVPRAENPGRGSQAVQRAQHTGIDARAFPRRAHHPPCYKVFLLLHWQCWTAPR